jgi:hypothetical protein
MRFHRRAGFAMERRTEASRQAISLRIQPAAVLNSSRNKSAKNLFFLEPR